MWQKKKGECRMDELFEKWGKRISDTIEDIGKKAEDTLEVQKMKSQISTLKRTNERDYVDMGKMIYEKYKNEEEIPEEFRPFCEAIVKRESEIDGLETEISRIKGE